MFDKTINKIKNILRKRTKRIPRDLGVNFSDFSKLIIPILRNIEWKTQRQYEMTQEIIRNNNFLYYDYINLLNNPDKIRNNKRIFIKTGYPIAYESNDYIYPESTVEGITRNPIFVEDCKKVLEKEKLNFLDIGCGGGGQVIDFLVDGHISAGIDGSDFCKKNKIGFWGVIPNNFFTCDATKPYYFEDDNKNKIKFDVITSWEVLEHIPEDSIDGLFSNIAENLDNGGFFIGSISLLEYVNTEKNIVYHVTLKPREWWKEKFEKNGLKIIDNYEFNSNYFYRGQGNRFQDVHDYVRNPEKGFWFIVQKI